MESLGVDRCGSVIAAGTVQASNYVGSEMTWLAAYQSDGELAWSSTERAGNGEEAFAIGLETEGQIVVGGLTTVSGLGILSNDRRPFVRSYSEDGAPFETLVFGEDREWVDELALDAQGDPLAVTNRGHVWLIGDEPLQLTTFTPSLETVTTIAEGPNGWLAVFGKAASVTPSTPRLVVLGADGEEAWHVDGDEYPLDLSFQDDGTIVVVEKPGADDVVVRRYDLDGGSIGVETIPLDPKVRVFASCVDRHGRVSLGGELEDDTARRLPWVARLSTDGFEWSWSQFDLPGDATVTALAVNDSGSVFAGARVDVSTLSGGSDADIWIGRFSP